MFGIIIKSVITFLVLYALLDIARKIVTLVISDKNESDNVFTVITVKNNENTVEGLVRSVVWQQLNSKNGGTLPKILIVDLGSSDETLAIIKRLAGDYSFIRAVSKEEYNDILEGKRP